LLVAVTELRVLPGCSPQNGAHLRCGGTYRVRGPARASRQL